MDVRPKKELIAARAELSGLLKFWRRRLMLSIALQASAVALLVFAMLFAFLQTELLVCLSLAGGAGLLTLAGQLRIHQEKITNFNLLVRHLNRIMPEMEESGELLLAEDSALSTLARMQRQRLLQALPELKTAFLPRQPWHFALRFFFGAVLLALFMLALAPFLEEHKKFRKGSSSAARPPAVSATAPNQILRIESAAIEIIPPRYTGKAPRSSAQLDLQAEEGARLIWHVTFNIKPQRAAMVLTNGDTLAARPAADGTFIATHHPRESSLYYVQAVDQTGKVRRFEYHRLEVVKDLPPEIVIMQPEPRTEIEIEHSKLVRLEAAIDDDYGVQHLELVATLARGSGEGIKFRENRSVIDNAQKESRLHWRVSTLLDLVRMGMLPGDELYFHLEARDNREPAAQGSRSDTYFVVMQDTATVQVVVNEGLLINPVPEYFRSQRQIIIDSEKLCQDQSRLSDNEFQRRSQNLGLDQQALRMRYGQFLGEESENEIISPTNEHDTEQESEAAGAKPLEDKSGSEKIIEQFAHRHDIEENATLFAPEIKTQLKAALSEMWEAELRLRTHRPKEALPFEYRALALLKAVQHSTRAYVQRVGFEPPPIKVEEKRLSGHLGKTSGGKWRHTTPEKSISVLQEALLALENFQGGAQNTLPRGVLERAGQELARHALMISGDNLQALQDLRTLITDMNNQALQCQKCVQSVRRALWQALPPGEILPGRRQQSRSAVAEKYFRSLASQRN